MFNKQGTSGLSEVTNNIDGTLATHAADCGRKRISQLFRFVLYFLDLEFSQEFIASDQEQGNTISMTSSATMGLNF